MQSFDRRFKQKSRNCYKIFKGKRQATTLRVNQVVTSDTNTIMTTWEQHFRELSRSKEEEFPILADLKEQVDSLFKRSLENEEMLLDTPFTAEEVDNALRRLKPGKAAGHDLLQPEHLKYGGEVIRIWVQQISNAIVELESVPDALRMGIVTPIYKGSGKDPLDTNSYRGITLTPVLAKVLELLILDRLQDMLMEKGLPHLNQTGYQKRVSCTEAIFSTLEVISQFAQ